MKCIWNVCRFVLTPCYERLNRPVLWPQSDINHEVRGLAEMVRGSRWRSGVGVDTLQFNQLRWWSFGRYASVDHLRRRRNGTFWSSERQVTDPWALSGVPGQLCDTWCSASGNTRPRRPIRAQIFAPPPWGASREYTYPLISKSLRAGRLRSRRITPGVPARLQIVGGKYPQQSG